MRAATCKSATNMSFPLLLGDVKQQNLKFFFLTSKGGGRRSPPEFIFIGPKNGPWSNTSFQITDHLDGDGGGGVFVETTAPQNTNKLINLTILGLN
jgi:hypothetical protein